jgi:glycosyltransferase involved in cell wall biosynthesis
MMDFVTLLGETDDVRAALSVMDIFVLPSISVETFSNAALEAMAMNKAVVLSDVGGAREMVSDNFDGRIFTPGDIQGLSDILLELAGNDAVRLRLGNAARKKASDQFKFSNMVDSYEELFWSLYG